MGILGGISKWGCMIWEWGHKSYYVCVHFGIRGYPGIFETQQNMKLTINKMGITAYERRNWNIIFKWQQLEMVLIMVKKSGLIATLCYSIFYSVYSISISLRKFEIHVPWDFGWTDNGWLLVSGLKNWCSGSITVVNHCQISNSRVFRSMWWVFQEFILPWLDCPSYWNNYSTYPQVDIEIIMFLKYCCYTFQ